MAFNSQLLACQRSELNALIQDRLLPLLQSKACLYFFTEPSLSKVQITEAINVPEETLALLPHMFISDPMTPKFLSGHRSVLAYDVDLDRSLSRKAIDQFFVDNPQFESQRSIYVDSVSAGMAALNLPNANVGLVVHAGTVKTFLLPRGTCACWSCCGSLLRKPSAPSSSARS